MKTDKELAEELRQKMDEVLRLSTSLKDKGYDVWFNGEGYMGVSTYDFPTAFTLMLSEVKKWNISINRSVRESL